MRRSYPENLPPVVTGALDQLSDDELQRLTAVYTEDGFDGVMLSDGRGWFYKPVEKLGVFDILDEQMKIEIRMMNSVEF